MFLLLVTPILSLYTILWSKTYICSYTRNRDNIKKAYPFDPKNTIILFDLHGVIFKHNYVKMVKTFWKSPLRWPFLRNLFDRYLLWDVAKLLRHRPVPESFFVHLARNYKQFRTAFPLFVQIANCQIVNKPMITLIKKLKANGYEVAILSNIGERIYIDLESQHHDIFHLFDHIMVCTPETHYVSKPSPQIYERFMREANQKNKHIVMIDDKKKNLYGAAAFGIIGLRFKNYKKLMNQLTRLGININRSH
jgi:HAD superfamily hydrolase (TIGR01509 family)